jgi:hypothetical protein
MQRIPRKLLAVLLTMLVVPASASDCRSLTSLEWLLGEWVADGAKSTFRETWTAVSSTSWEGQGVETSKADPSKSSAEVLRLVEMADGVFYISKVTHNELPVAFRLSECEGGRFAFVNPAHDFPRRLDYLRGADGRLQVRVSDGGEKGFTLDFARAPDSDANQGAVLAAEDARFAAMVKADAQAMRQWFADDLEYAHTTGEIEDRDRLIAAITSGGKRYLAIEPVERRVVFSSPESAFVQGIAAFRVMAGPRLLEFKARYLAVYGLNGGAWRLRAWQSMRLP